MAQKGDLPAGMRRLWRSTCQRQCVARALVFTLIMGFGACSEDEISNSQQPPVVDVSGGDGSASGSDLGGVSTLPTVAITSPSPGTVVPIGDELVVFAEVSHPSEQVSTLVVTWASDINGALDGSPPNRTGLAELRVSSLAAGNHTITVTVTDKAGGTVSDAVTVLVNAPPTAPVVSIEPSEPVTTDDLSVTISVDADDLNRSSGNLEYRYRWTKNGEAAGPEAATISAALTQKGEVWQVEVIAFDGFVEGALGTAQVNIKNSRPSCDQAVILPSSGTTLTDFECQCASGSDADSDDTVTSSCVFKNHVTGELLNAAEATSSSCLLPASATSKGLEIRCTLTPEDGEDSGESLDAPTVLVLNSPPTPPSDVQITPEVGTVATVFNCNYADTASDPDSDELVYEITWVVNAFENPGTTSATVLVSELESSLGVAAKKGDEVRCRVRSSDGETTSIPTDSSPVTLKNSAPEGGTVVLGPVSATVESELECIADEANDSDGDLVGWTYSWLVDGITVDGATASTLIGVFEKGNVVSCIATPTDGEAIGDPVPSKAAVTIANTLPVITSAVVSPEQTNKQGEFSCAYTGWSDPDPSDTPEVGYQWFLVSKVPGDAPSPIALQTNATYAPSELAPGDEVFCRVIPKNGEIAGSPVDSNVVVISNAKPSLASVELSPTTAYKGTTLSCTPVGYEDNDGDAANYSFVWQVNGVDVPDETQPTLAGAFQKGQTVRCAVTPNDGYVDGAAVLSNPVVIANTLPQLAGVTLSPSYGAICDDYDCLIDAVNDVDDDELAYGYQWYVNDSLVVEQSATLSGANIAPGDVLRCSISVSDGSVGPAPDFQELAVTKSSNEAQVYNTPPSITATVIEPTDASVGDVLECVPQGFTDPECEPAPAYVYSWLIGTDVVENATESTFATSDLASGVGVSCRAIPYDGIDFGSPVLSAPVVLKNTAPTAPVVSLLALAGADGDIECVVETEAFDADALSKSFSWTVNGQELSESSAVLSAAEVQHCDKVTCQQVVTDGEATVVSNVPSLLLPIGQDCADGELCTTEVCKVEGGCDHTFNTLECSDGNACTQGDVCINGSCEPGTAISCDNGDLCDGVETCDPSIGCIEGTPVDCSDPGDACLVNECNPQTGACDIALPDGTDCSDESLCNGVETCQGGTCQAGTPVVCTPSEALCTETACSEQSGECEDTELSDCCGNGATEGDEICDDGNAVAGDGCSPQCELDCSNASNVLINSSEVVSSTFAEPIPSSVYIGLRISDIDKEGGNQLAPLLSYLGAFIIKEPGTSGYQSSYSDPMNDPANWRIREGLSGCGDSAVFNSGNFLCKSDTCTLVYVGRTFSTVGDFRFVFDVRVSELVATVELLALATAPGADFDGCSNSPPELDIWDSIVFEQGASPTVTSGGQTELTSGLPINVFTDLSWGIQSSQGCFTQNGICGDGQVTGTEKCDEGDLVNEFCPYGDTECVYCDGKCTWVDAPEFCGDGTVNGPEACDAGPNPSAYCAYGEPSCTVCTDQCENADGIPVGYCGDGQVNDAFGEVCDPGCTEAIKYEWVASNGQVTAARGVCQTTDSVHYYGANYGACDAARVGRTVGIPKAIPPAGYTWEVKPYDSTQDGIPVEASGNSAQLSADGSYLEWFGGRDCGADVIETVGAAIYTCTATPLCTPQPTCADDCQSLCGDGSVPGAQLCDDGNDCTVDTCDPSTGCTNTPLADGTLCGAGEQCLQGFCGGSDCYDFDGSSSGTCAACTVCDIGTMQLSPCVVDQDTVCEPCGYGTYDHDNDPDTACVSCDACPLDELEIALCSPVSNAICSPCGTNPFGQSTSPHDPASPDTSLCAPFDPDCLDGIDVVVFYTPSMLELLSGDITALEEMLAHTVYVANQSLEQSLIPPNYRYRLVGVELFDYEERDVLKSDLVFLRNNPYHQARRKALGADVSMFYFGTQGYGGLAYSNAGLNGYEERGLFVMDAYYLTSDFNKCGTTYTTPSHEIGHILGAGHRASQYSNANGTGYGYHNQEVHLRRNEAFGLDVSQHDLKFFTLMSYQSYENPYGTPQACLDCRELNVFASPDLWWFFDPSDSLHGTCLVIDASDTQAIQLSCSGDTPFVLSGGGYTVNQDTIHTLTAPEIIARAVPLGVSTPSYNDPITGDLVQMGFTTDNRSKVLSFWPSRANNATPRATYAQCTQDCLSQHRAPCAVNNFNTCGTCLPEFYDDGVCIGRREADPTEPISDEKYALTSHTVPAGGATTSLEIPLAGPTDLIAIELYLMTLDSAGQIDFAWAQNLSTVWSQPPGPPHTLAVRAETADGTVVDLGFYPEDPAAGQGLEIEPIQDNAGQKNTTLSYVKVIDGAVSDVVLIRIELTSADESGLSETYGFGFSEVRVFGNETP